MTDCNYIYTVKYNTLDINEISALFSDKQFFDDAAKTHRKSCYSTLLLYFKQNEITPGTVRRTVLRSAVMQGECNILVVEQKVELNTLML